MSVADCAQIVRRGDPDRFLAAMAAPPAARAVLFPLYALNVEFSRAPWVTQEPMLARMRLQWWRDALHEVAAGQPLRRHEVTNALGFLDADGAALLDRAIAAREWDIETEAHADDAAVDAYLDATAGHLMWVAARALGMTDEAQIRAAARAAGLARYLMAIPALEAAGRRPLVDGRAPAIRDLAARYLAAMPAIRGPAMLEAWQARPILRQAIADPGRVARGDLGLGETAKRARLLWAAR